MLQLRVKILDSGCNQAAQSLELHQMLRSFYTGPLQVQMQPHLLLLHINPRQQPNFTNGEPPGLWILIFQLQEQLSQQEDLLVFTAISSQPLYLSLKSKQCLQPGLRILFLCPTGKLSQKLRLE